MNFVGVHSVSHRHIRSGVSTTKPPKHSPTISSGYAFAKNVTQNLMTALKRQKQKAMQPLIPSERDEQVAFARWLTANRYRFTSIPNAGKRTARYAQKQKEEGLNPGLPDLLIIVRNQLVWIEMKKKIYKNRKNGGLSENQMAWHKVLNACDNCQVFVAYGSDEARSIIIGIK